MQLTFSLQLLLQSHALPLSSVRKYIITLMSHYVLLSPTILNHVKPIFDRRSFRSIKVDSIEDKSQSGESVQSVSTELTIYQIYLKIFSLAVDKRKKNNQALSLSFIITYSEYRSFRQRVTSPTTSSPTTEVVSPTSNVSSPTLICQPLRDPMSKILFRFAWQWMKERGISCMALSSGRNGLFGSAVDKRTKNNKLLLLICV